MTIYTSYDAFLPKDVPFGGFVYMPPHLGGQVPQKQFWWREQAFPSQTAKIDSSDFLGIQEYKFLLVQSCPGSAPMPANHRSGHALIGSGATPVGRVSCHHAAQRASHSPTTQRPPAVQAAVAPLKCLHLITVGQCDATASVVPLIEIQNIKRTALCPIITR